MTLSTSSTHCCKRALGIEHQEGYDESETCESFADAFPDECAPFIGIFGCDMRAPPQGTIIRIPLRLKP